MKANLSILICLLSCSLFLSNDAFGQSKKKSKARLNISYVKIMNEANFFDIKASSRIKKKTIKLTGIEIEIYNKTDEDRILLGKTKTDHNGESRFSLKSLNQLIPDSTGVYHLFFSFKGNDQFSKANKNITFKDAIIESKVIKKDSLNLISARLTDAVTGDPVADESLTVQVQRLIKPLRIGKEFNNTNDDGRISIPIEKGIPGLDGNLNIEVVLNESDDYGTVKSVISAPAGTNIQLNSTFDQRTMWSPRNKTPYFFLIFPNLLIIGIWGFIIYLISNLFKISKL